MLKKALLATAATLALGLGGVGAAKAHGYGEYGMMGHHQMHRMMHQHMMQHHMMGRGMTGCPYLDDDEEEGMMGRGMMMGPDMMGSGMRGHGMMMGRGMRGQGMRGQGGQGGQGMMMGRGMMGEGTADGDADLTADDVRARLERWLDWHGNTRLKVGEVKEEGEDVVADIVTQDGSLVDRFRVDRQSGVMQRVQ